MTRLIRAALGAIVCLCAVAASAESAQRTSASLSVVNFGPHGEVQNIAEAKEIRIVFSEPMVSLGTIPERVRPPYVRITPAIPGTFRWSGTTILIFTADPKRPLPYATTYQVRVDAAATAVSGRKLAKPVTFSFTTPTVKLLETEWYRRGGRYDGTLIVAMRFNQRVRDSDVAAHMSAAFTPHEWELPELDALRARLAAVNREWLQQLNVKVTATRAVAAARGAVSFLPAVDWDKKRFPPKGDLIVLETKDAVPPESWVTLTLDPQLPSPAGPATPARHQEYVVKVEQAFFVDRAYCMAECNPDDSNPLVFRRPVKVTEFAGAASARDVTTPTQVGLAKPHQPRLKDEYGNVRDIEESLTLEDAGFDAQPPAHTYLVTVDGSLKSADGQSLGYTWLGRIENWHRPAFTSFGDGHGVWEKDGGPLLPFYSRNFRNVTQWAASLPVRDLMPTLRRLVGNAFREVPAGSGTERQLGVTADQIQSHGLDIGSVLGANKTGLLWAAVRPGTAIPLSKVYDGDITRATVVQVTNLGITVKDSPQNTLIFVTRLDNGSPVAGADVSIVRLDNSVFWRGRTGTDGMAIASNTPLRDRNRYDRFQFLVTAEKDGDIAYVGSDWNEGIEPWAFGTAYNPNQADPMLRGSIFTDRGVYRLGEEVHFKAVLRHNTPTGVRLLAAGTPVVISIRDSEDRAVDTRTVKVNAWSSSEWTMTLPTQGALGGYSVKAVLEADMPKPKAPEALRPGETPGRRTDEYLPYEKTVYSSFLVAAYRRPDFRVDVTLGADPLLSGTTLNGTITAKYLFGAAMGPRPVKWTYTRSVAYGVPKPVRE
jgi:alpha-2-macroglobulin